MKMEKIGIVGVGAMGSALLERLKLAGVQPAVYDIDPAALESARSLGAHVASSAAEVARAATIIDVVVRTDQEVLDCTMGREGILEGASPESLVILHSTILPDTTKKVAAAARERQIDVIDACMVGIPRVVRDGKLTFLVGGPADLVERARPHLLRMGKQVLHMGPLGSGNVAKLVKNLTTGAESLVIYEAVQIAEAAGIPYRETLEMMRKVYSAGLLEHWESAFDASGKINRPRASHNIFEKDIPLAAEFARASGLRLPITEQLAAVAKELVEAERAAR
jgi:3-hydroxyisobutyrate dehydrogenase-like beta-hydroxyacid dehydrogenase